MAALSLQGSTTSALGGKMPITEANFSECLTSVKSRPSRNSNVPNHLVPVIVPEDTVDGLKKLSEPQLRRDCNVKIDNCYLFPSTVASEDHASGWYAINNVCEKAGIEKGQISATKIRHRFSTLYACLDIPEAQRGIFFKHMGHSQNINENIYQVPPAEAEMFHVGAILHEFG